MIDPVREAQALRQELDALATRSALREQALLAEIDSLKQALCVRHTREPEGEGAARAPAPLRDGEPDIDVFSLPPQPTENGLIRKSPTIKLDDLVDDMQPEPHTPVEDTSSSERSMELATPLHRTILSLAPTEDDFLLSVAVQGDNTFISLANATIGADPATVPLPLSPDYDGEPTSPESPLAPFGHRASLSLLDADASLVPLPPSRSTSTSPPAAMRISADLLARVESATQARVTALEREVIETQRELDARTLELADREAALDQMRQS